MERNSSVRNTLSIGQAKRLLTVAIMIGSSAALAQATPGTNAIVNCIECHGNDGIGTDPDIPHLNGMPEPLLGAMLDSFRQGKRPPKVRIHREIPATDVTPIARHYAQQKAVRPKSAVDTTLLAKGESLYQQRCADCHLDNGRDSDKEAPLTAGQSLSYLIAQTLAFKSGERKFPYLMDGAYRDLGDDDLTAIAHFFAAQDQFAPQQGRRRRR